jgi:hypothetical protein
LRRLPCAERFERSPAVDDIKAIPVAQVARCEEHCDRAVHVLARRADDRAERRLGQPHRDAKALVRLLAVFNGQAQQGLGDARADLLVRHAEECSADLAREHAEVLEHPPHRQRVVREELQHRNRARSSRLGWAPWPRHWHCGRPLGSKHAHLPE